MLSKIRYNKNGFASIVEVIVTAVIFVVAAAGILTAVTMLAPEGEESARKLEAAYVAKGHMDDLRRQISADTWDAGGSAFEAGITHTINDPTYPDYTIEYTLYNEPGLDVRKMIMVVTYPDP